MLDGTGIGCGMRYGDSCRATVSRGSPLLKDADTVESIGTLSINMAPLMNTVAPEGQGLSCNRE